MNQNCNMIWSYPQKSYTTSSSFNPEQTDGHHYTIIRAKTQLNNQWLIYENQSDVIENVSSTNDLN